MLQHYDMYVNLICIDKTLPVAILGGVKKTNVAISSARNPHSVSLPITNRLFSILFG